MDLSFLIKKRVGLIFSDFLNYQTQSSKVINFKKNYFMKKNQRKALFVLLILRRKRRKIQRMNLWVNDGLFKKFQICTCKGKES